MLFELSDHLKSICNIFRLAMLRYWNRLCKLDNSFICKQIFNYEIDNLKKYTWVFNIKQIFMSLNLLSHFNEKKSVDLSICNKLLLKIMQEDWETKLPKIVYLGFYVAFNTVQVISRRVVGKAEETSTYSSLGFCTVNCRPTASNYQLSHLRP